MEQMLSNQYVKKSDLERVDPDSWSLGPSSNHNHRHEQNKFPEIADLQLLQLKLRQMMDNVLIHRSCQTREVQEGRRFEIIAGDHGFLASFELVLWTDPERYSDLLHYRKLVHMIDWSISRIISDRTLDPKRLLQLLRWRKQRRKFEPIFFFNGPKFQYCE